VSEINNDFDQATNQTNTAIRRIM